MSNIDKARGNTFVDQYRSVGQLFGEYIQKTKTNNPKKWLIAESVLANVASNTKLEKFYRCFCAWVEGAGISQLHGMYLLADNMSGCQTMMVRYKSGIALLHTEEDFNDVQTRMTKPHTIQFDYEGRKLNSLVYNDLIPGAGLYGWQRDMIVGVDSLWLKEDGVDKLKRPILANIIAWLIWQLRPEEADAENVVSMMKQLGSVVDGYAVNVVRRTASGIEGYKLTFARNDYEIERLWDQPGDNLRQVNIVEPRYARAKKPVAVWRHAPWRMYVDYRGFLKRLRDMKAHVQLHKQWLQHLLQAEQIETVHRAVQRAVFSNYREAYVSEWMGAMCVGLVDNLGTSVSVKLNDQQPLDALEYVDII